VTDPSSDVRGQLQAALGDAYTIERELGGGGMSRVFVASERALGRSVVIKVIAPELGEGLSADRFTREVKLAARLQQANIVPLLNAGDANGLAYYTMPFVEGSSLRTRLETLGPLAMGPAIHVLRDVAKALAYAHAHGVVHRDIKPENVLLSGGTAMVIDFGIAKAIASAKRGDRPAGDKHEQSVGVRVDARGHFARDTRVHGAGAGGRLRGRSARRPVFLGSSGVRAPHRRASIRRPKEHIADGRRAHRRDTRFDRPEKPGDSSVDREHRRAMSRERTKRTSRVGR
jgi:serine/threonine protein kinase